jgi:hypothetical protein
MKYFFDCCRQKDYIKKNTDAVLDNLDVLGHPKRPKRISSDFMGSKFNNKLTIEIFEQRNRPPSSAEPKKKESAGPVEEKKIDLESSKSGLRHSQKSSKTPANLNSGFNSPPSFYHQENVSNGSKKNENASKPPVSDYFNKESPNSKIKNDMDRPISKPKSEFLIFPREPETKKNSQEDFVPDFLGKKKDSQASNLEESSFKEKSKLSRSTTSKVDFKNKKFL